MKQKVFCYKESLVLIFTPELHVHRFVDIGLFYILYQN